MELYQAEKQGKQIMMRKSAIGFFASYQSIDPDDIIALIS